jgi:hypothetical protein
MGLLGFSHTRATGKTSAMLPERWERLRWLASIDERVLWMTLAAALVMGLWGAFVGWRSRGRDETGD